MFHVLGGLLQIVKERSMSVIYGEKHLLRGVKNGDLNTILYHCLQGKYMYIYIIFLLFLFLFYLFLFFKERIDEQLWWFRDRGLFAF